MYCVRKVTEDLYWVGGNDHRLSLFENIHPIPRGVSYNSYLLLDKKTVLFDTVDWTIGRQFIENIQAVLDGRKLDYLVVNHMEPDHGACIEEIILRYPAVKIISTEKSIMFMRQFGFPIDGRVEQVQEGDTREFGKHKILFVAAPMVHWPEAMVSFDLTNGVLFSADAFGSFGALDGKLFNDEVDFDRDWIDDARRYYTNI
ncbi:MAG: FprA family A-type flavoprotein, partial [Clostridium sp.]